jgi:hypothetical protein
MDKERLFHVRLGQAGALTEAKLPNNAGPDMDSGVVI